MRKPFSLVIILTTVVLLVSVAWRDSAASIQTKGKATGAGAGAAGLYKQHCVKCHLVDGKGLESLEPPDFTDTKWQSENTDKQIAEGIRNGEGVMPEFKDVLTPAQITSLVKYVRAFGPKPAKAVPKK